MSDLVRKLLSGPAVTVRPVPIQDTWGPRLLTLSEPHEAKCHLCGVEHGPDTRQACGRWAEGHLKAEHGVPVAGEYEVQSGQERW